MGPFVGSQAWADVPPIVSRLTTQSLALSRLLTPATVAVHVGSQSLRNVPYTYSVVDNLGNGLKYPDHAKFNNSFTIAIKFVF